ncbi:MAG: hypothetical protein AAF597_16705, partial [Bacteroidota bacterium]
KDLKTTVQRLAKKHLVDIKVLETGFSTKGGDLGSGRYDLVGKPKVAVLGGERVNANQFGLTN